MRFPRYSVGLLLLALALFPLTAALAHDDCVGSYGNFHCKGWASPFAAIVLMWQSFGFLLIVPVAVVAALRLGQWLWLTSRAR